MLEHCRKRKYRILPLDKYDIGVYHPCILYLFSVSRHSTSAHILSDISSLMSSSKYDKGGRDHTVDYEISDDLQVTIIQMYGFQHAMYEPLHGPMFMHIEYAAGAGEKIF